MHARHAVLKRREDDLQLEERRVLGLLAAARSAGEDASPEVAVLKPGLWASARQSAAELTWRYEFCVRQRALRTVRPHHVACRAEVLEADEAIGVARILRRIVPQARRRHHPLPRLL